MAKLLMVVSSARTIRLADGRDHPTGYLAEEVLEPYEMFEAAGVDVVIASLEGKVPESERSTDAAAYAVLKRLTA
jgi:putative intracellular protease/amidase